MNNLFEACGRKRARPADVTCFANPGYLCYGNRQEDSLGVYVCLWIIKPLGVSIPSVHLNHLRHQQQRTERLYCCRPGKRATTRYDTDYLL